MERRPRGVALLDAACERELFADAEDSAARAAVELSVRVTRALLASDPPLPAIFGGPAPVRELEVDLVGITLTAVRGRDRVALAVVDSVREAAAARRACANLLTHDEELAP